MTSRSWKFFCAVPCTLLACGGESRKDPGGPASGGSSGTGAAGASGKSAGAGNAGAGSGGESGSPCPIEPPSSGSSCTIEHANGSSGRADCTYGDDSRPYCRVLALCLQGRWQVTPPAERCSEPPLASACPGEPPATGAACSDSTLACWYDDGTHCECSPCLGGSPYPICRTIEPPEWTCGTPPAGCPNPLPHAGEPCTESGLSCGPSCEDPIRCKDGAWSYELASCPICASPDTPIATPQGERAIAELQPGDLVYSVDDRAVVAVPLLLAGATRVTNHHVVRVALDSGAVLELSPGHPTADGRRFSELGAGSRLDDRHTVLRAEVVPYRYERTFDILPASSTGTYFAAGALVGTTLRPRPSSGQRLGSVP